MSVKKYRIEYVDCHANRHHFIDDEPYNFVVYNVQDGSLVDARELAYGQSGWLTADQMGCRFTLANVMEVDDRIWRLTSNDYWVHVLYYQNQEIWHDDTVDDLIFNTLVWINAHQPDVPQEQIDLWLRQEQDSMLADKHLCAIRGLYGDDDE